MKSTVVLILLQALWTVHLTGCEAQLTGSETCPAEQREAWSYRGRNGPSKWGEKYEECYGEQQSPINIETSKVEPDSNLQPLKLNNYDSPLTAARLDNNGHTVHVEPTDNVERSIQIGQNKYTLRQFHFHWGVNYERGSEHTINGKEYANELHFVHTNDDGEIAVVGVLFQEQLNNNAEMNPLITALRNIEFKGNETELKSDVSLECLVPQNPVSYYRYKGSLTTPDCSENVIWSVAKDLVPIGKQQMEAFRNLKAVSKEDYQTSNGQCKLVDNFRPIQPLNGRTVSSSV